MIYTAILWFGDERSLERPRLCENSLLCRDKI